MDKADGEAPPSGVLRARRRGLVRVRAASCCAARAAAAVDLLDGTLDASNIKGGLVLDAGAARRARREAFVVRLFRDRSTQGFVRAISEAPERLGGGFARRARARARRRARALAAPRRREPTAWKGARAIDNRGLGREQGASLENGASWLPSPPAPAS